MDRLKCDTTNEGSDDRDRQPSKESCIENGHDGGRDGATKIKRCAFVPRFSLRSGNAGGGGNRTCTHLAATVRSCFRSPDSFSTEPSTSEWLFVCSCLSINSWIRSNVSFRTESADAVDISARFKALSARLSLLFATTVAAMVSRWSTSRGDAVPSKVRSVAAVGICVGLVKVSGADDENRGDAPLRFLLVLSPTPTTVSIGGGAGGCASVCAAGGFRLIFPSDGSAVVSAMGVVAGGAFVVDVSDPVVVAIVAVVLVPVMAGANAA